MSAAIRDALPATMNGTPFRVKPIAALSSLGLAAGKAGLGGDSSVVGVGWGRRASGGVEQRLAIGKTCSQETWSTAGVREVTRRASGLRQTGYRTSGEPWLAASIYGAGPHTGSLLCAVHGPADVRRHRRVGARLVGLGACGAGRLRRGPILGVRAPQQSEDAGQYPQRELQRHHAAQVVESPSPSARQPVECCQSTGGYVRMYCQSA